jgi:predicted O-linked N-acetylglucosamine transferase (SPINDLY family)/SAM-dependent methyltransferase
MFGFLRKKGADAAATERPGEAVSKQYRRPRVLNVGGNNKSIPIPAQYDGWEHVLLDIDPAGAPDIVCDARQLEKLEAGAFDSVYCAHNLEHYHWHEVPKVLRGFLHVLRDDGYALICVPDMEALMRTVVARGLDIEDVLYESPAGPITVRDVIYGYGKEIAESGNDFYAHKTGFTAKSLAAALETAGFRQVSVQSGNLELTALARKQAAAGEERPVAHIEAAAGAVAGGSAVQLRKRGNRLLAEGNLEAAAACYREAVAADGADAAARLNLGYALKALGLEDEARRQLEAALNLDAGMEDAHFLLGTLDAGQGRPAEAAEHFAAALARKPDFEIARRELCRELFRDGQYVRARSEVEAGLRLHPDSADLLHYLGNLQQHEGDYAGAIASYEKALALRPDYVEVRSNLCKALLDLGRIDAAEAQYRAVLDQGEASLATEAHSCLLFARCYRHDDTPEAYLAEARRYGARVAAQARPFADWPMASRDAYPLKVGLVSGDFIEHPVGYFLENVLAHLDPARLALTAYPTLAEEDALTARIRPYLKVWRPIGHLDDEAAARRIREDGIQVLIDLAGHTGRNRLPVFAWRPAPVQATWLGYFASTGVPGMDYLLADPVSVPERAESQFTESVWRLPDTRLCFTPPDTQGLPARTPLPALRRGHLTFGCFQNVAKLNGRVLALWGRIFAALPQARLRLQSRQLDEPSVRENIIGRLGRAGIAPERVVLQGGMTRRDYLAAYAEVDAVLDTFPYPGGTTTCEALWMGVPTLTLAGNTMLSRQGASLLSCAGLTDWIATDEEDYLARALALAADLDGLAQLRAGLRETVAASPLFDAPRFARQFESALAGMWRRHLSVRAGGEWRPT